MTRADLATRPGARLYYPGSKVVRVVGADQSPTKPGEEPNPAYVGAILTASASPEQLYAWYGHQLAAHGFTPAADYRPATEISGQAWQQHHRLEVQVGVFDPRRLQDSTGLAVEPPPGGVVYEEVLVGYAPGLPTSG